MSSPLVLVIDDDPDVRRTLAALLRAHGIESVTAEDGRAGLETFRDVSPDLVLCDVMMPYVDGFEVCRRVRADPATRLTPIVLVTGLGASDDRVRGIEAGADDFLSKPFDTVELLARVRSLLRVKSYTDELDRAEAVLFTLARTIEERDPYTEGHCERLSTYGSLLGEGLGLPEADVKAIRQAGVVHDIGKVSVRDRDLADVVHDIGKVSVPDQILHKNGPLTPDERRVMEKHAVAGERICESLKSFRPLLPIIRHHHEKLDGSGYPDGLRGEDIPVTARVIQIVDVFDALATERPYRDALPADQALEILEEEVARGWWDGEIFDEFKNMVRCGLPSVDQRPG